MICFACNESLSDKQPWVILSRRIKKRECQGCRMGFDSEAVVLICVLCAEKGTHETLSIRCAMEPLLELERDTIIQYLRRTADNNGLYPALPLPPVCMSCRMELHDPSRPVHVEMYTVRFERKFINRVPDTDDFGADERRVSIMCQWCRSEYESGLRQRSFLSPPGGHVYQDVPVERNTLSLGQVCGTCAIEYWGVDTINGRLPHAYSRQQRKKPVAMAQPITSDVDRFVRMRKNRVKNRVFS